MFPAERPAVSVIVEKLQHVVANVITGVGCQSHRHWLAGLLTPPHHTDIQRHSAWLMSYSMTIQLTSASSINVEKTKILEIYMTKLR